MLLADLLKQALQFIADISYDAAKPVLDLLKEAHIEIVIAPKANRKDQRSYDEELYKWRHLIENLFQKLKQYRAIATRYDKRAVAFLGGIYLAADVIWLN